MNAMKLSSSCIQAHHSSTARTLAGCSKQVGFFSSLTVLHCHVPGGIMSSAIRLDRIDDRAGGFCLVVARGDAEGLPVGN